MPAVAITDRRWLVAQIEAAARRYRYYRPAGLGVLWWYSASSVLLGPPVESLLHTGIATDPGLDTMTLYLHADGRLLDARSDSLLGNDITADNTADNPDDNTTDNTAGNTEFAQLGRRLARTLDTAINSVAGCTGAPVRALWAIATDSLANRVLWAGGDPAAARRLANTINMAGPVLPMPRFLEVSGRTIVRRASCCLIYEAPGQVKCVSCPRQRPDDRLRRLREVFGQVP